MSSTFRFHSQVNEVVPANAIYTFPNQSTKVNKQTVKLVPKNGSTFSPGNVLRIEFPSDNYLNVLNSVLQFDVEVTKTPILMSTILATNIIEADCDAAPNSDTVVTIITGLGTGGATLNAAANVAATSGATGITTLAAWTTAANTYNGCTLAVNRGGLVFTAVIATSDYTAITNSGGTATTICTGRAQSLYLSTPLACGQVEPGDIISIYTPHAFQRGGASNVIKRLKIAYGSLVLEDIPEYKTLVRILYECGVQKDFSTSHGQVVEGMYNSMPADNRVTALNGLNFVPEYSATRTAAMHTWVVGGGRESALGTTPVVHDIHTTRAAIQATQASILSKGVVPGQDLAKLDLVPRSYVNSSNAISSTPSTLFNFGAKTFTLNLLSGILTQKKLLPLKWMAAQLVIEITLATPEDAMIAANTTETLTYQLTNVNFIAEMLEFDSVYDTGLYDGLQSGGIPIKYGTFHFHSHNLTGTNQTIQIHERSRSVKGAFAVIRTTQPASFAYDSDRFFASVGETFNTTSGFITSPQNGAIDTFQWRVGGRYYPAQPVRCQFGGAEAYLELQKLLNNLGDYTRGSQISSMNWVAGGRSSGSSFIFGCEFENTDVFPDTIAGINAEEQSDIALQMIFDTRGTVTNKKLDVFMYIDALMIVRDGNIVNMII